MNRIPRHSFATLTFGFSPSVFKQFVHETDAFRNVLPNDCLRFAYRHRDCHQTNFVVLDCHNESIAVMKTKRLPNCLGYRDLARTSQANAVRARIDRRGRQTVPVSIYSGDASLLSDKYIPNELVACA